MSKLFVRLPRLLSVVKLPMPWDIKAFGASTLLRVAKLPRDLLIPTRISNRRA
jgi:hypothetical protein